MNNPRYQKSVDMYERAKRSIPLASQTFSKSSMQYPVGTSPLFIEKGEGSKVWDVDGHQYCDFVNGLLCILLGYQDPKVDHSVKEQLAKGVTFSLPHPIETKVAEKIIDMVPCAEMVRFGKNGSDVTAGAVRLARCITQKDYVVVCGYHGWQDWYIGITPRDAGVPEPTKQLTLSFQYNQIESLKAVFQAYPNKIAAVIMEPMNFEYPKEGFLQQVKEVTNENGALLIFDEIITGFRFDNGGAQALFNVTPDLATFGKGLANGYPLSVVCGPKAYMEYMEEVFFSFTFGGECLSLAAADAVLTQLQEKPVLATIKDRGKYLTMHLQDIISQHQLQNQISLVGHPAWTLLKMMSGKHYTARHLSTYLSQELFKHGILSLGTHNLSYAHSQDDINHLLSIYDKALFTLSHHIQSDSLIQAIEADMIQDVFQVRSTATNS